ncbi:alpha/beta hydrolase [Kitasatospora sp. NPDC089797]|uniref:alpha/beta hydrolase n=1 Tax=Kitasatospora sp. NPDC089797 TaxID=3155298 RepID=UPI003419C073
MSAPTFPRLVMAGLGACLAAGLAHQVYATVATRAGHQGFERRTVRCSSGNLLTVHLRPGTPGRGTLVCEAGLMNTSAAWLLVADHLDPGLSLVLYDRAGYRSSLRRCPEQYSLHESVQDLAEVVGGTVTDSGPCVLAGHSLGGLLAHRAAAVCDRVDAVVLVDPTHPAELMNSAKQRAGSQGIDMTMKLGPWSAFFGAGLLIDKDGLFAFAEGSPHRRTLRLESSAPTTWRAARREWGYSYAHMLDAGGRPLDRLGVPVSVLAAESTLRDTPEHAALYEEFLASGTGGELVTAPGSSHLSITCGPECAPFTGGFLAEAVAGAVRRNPQSAPGRGGRELEEA